MSCSRCNKTTLMLFECRCGKTFCMKHKLPEKHKCDFDYKNNAKDNIKINNPKIINDKFEKNIN